MADTYEPIFDPIIYKAMRLVYEDNVSSSKELKDMVLSAIQSRNTAPSPMEDTVSSTGSTRPPSSKGTNADPVRAASAKEEMVEVKEDPYEFDEIPTSSISIGRKSAPVGGTPFSDGCSVCQKSKNDSPGNKLFECTECHRVYHQNCHSPPIRDKADCKVDDPRFVFYCCDCAPAAAPEATYTSRPAATSRAASSTNLTVVGWTVNRPSGGAAQAGAAPVAATIKAGKRRLPSEDD